METFTKELQSSLSPQDAIDRLKAGNKRFVANKGLERDLLTQVNITSGGQYPFAALLSCIDSRVPGEMVFDEGIGSVFNVRVAGNVVNEDVLGSLEYSCKVAGSKVIVVLGHTKCGAVTAACQHVELGNITHLLSKIKPAVDQVLEGEADPDTIEKVALRNIEVSIERIRAESPILAEMESNGEIAIVGAVYDVASGVVCFM
ncbi:carbonic anhydrase family protein [Lutimonas zeaxanthinifaciens]|uniref:carbonic anhydrase family protein n=1 Tax=Lutimonas zeaxanthinifaciens TaxID=3060215 RepID=UPI00265D0B45|nr:carbonic anhydrase family protein [Lutimonas sp. YSD2104]WKK67299.1 carbonic anhydrase family protein [Lutimonas sp. YSD2104]